MGRKLIVGAAAVVVVVLLFVAYLRLTGAKGISVQGVCMQDIASDSFDPQAQRINDTVIHTVQQSRYTIYEPQTKTIHRIFGFKRLLNPGSSASSWQVERPYINFFEKQFQCRMDAEEGIFQVDTSGGTPVPQNAQFSGKVVIRLVPSGRQRFSETVILLDDLNYNSERLEFYTDGPVELVSAQSHLVGRGLLMVYNPAAQQIEYFEIKRLEYLRLKNIARSSLLGKTSTASPESAAAEPNLPQAVAEPNVAAVPQNEPNAANLYYQCTLNDTVRIVYGDQAIVDGAQQINISNILFGQKSDLTEKESEPNESPIVANHNIAAGHTITESASSQETETDWENRALLPSVPADDDANDVLVTCRGKLIYGPLSRIQAVADANAAGVEVASLAGEPQTADANAVSVVQASETSSKAAHFSAAKIDYDVLTGSAVAAGPIVFQFYPPAESNSPGSSLPVVIKASQEAKFLTDQARTIRQAVFYGSVVGSSTEQTAASKTIHQLFGDELAVDLAADANGKTQMSHVAVVGRSVLLESLQFLGDVKSSHVRLTCRRFDYDVPAQAVIAAGPGEIQLNNQNAPVDANAQPFNFRGPCVALVNGFDAMTWLLGENKIRVDSANESMKLSYMTLKEGKPDSIINVQTMDADILMADNAAGGMDLKEVLADNGVYMEQVGRHTLKGRKLHYLADSGWVHIEGDDNQPCFVDGVKAPAIQYNLQTQQLKTTLSAAPGAVGLPQQ